MKQKNILPYLLLIPFSIGLICALTGLTKDFDTRVFIFLREYLSPALDLPLKILTTLGNPKSVIAIVVILLLIPKVNKKIGLPAALITLASWIMNELIKIIVSRQRPEFMLFEETSYSFPSGHAMNNSALYLTILLSLLLIIKNIKAKIILSVVFTVLPFLIGASRVYFGVHYLTDVISGWALGTFIAIIGFRIFRRLFKNECH